jgi:type II restriction/modification system DNA methylase subunit YeeA
MQALRQAEYLTGRYHVVIANPPYMGGKGMNGRLKIFLKNEYADVKSDLFSAFIVRNTELALPQGQLGFMTPFVWMFISSYEKLRNFLIDEKTITSLVQLEYSGFDGATVPICTFTLENAHNPSFKGGYIRLSDFKGAAVQGPKCLEIIQAANRAGK